MSALRIRVFTLAGMAVQLRRNTHYPREVVKAALGKNAAAVILAHNHPSGLANPSDADKAITDRLKDVLEVVDVQVLDHFVVGQHDVVSFAEQGWV